MRLDHVEAHGPRRRALVDQDDGRLTEGRLGQAVDALRLALYTAEVSPGFAGPRFLGDNIERISGFPARAFETAGFWAARIHPADRDRVMVEAAVLPEQDAFATEYRWLCADGTFRSFFDRAVVVRDADGNAGEVFGTWLDVTGHRVLERQFAHTQVLDAIGRLTGGIAHDLNNMLAAVVGSLDLLMSAVKGDDMALKRAERALQGALRCADFTQRLLYFGRPQPQQSSAVDLNELAERTMESLRRTIGDQVMIEVRPGESLWLALAEPSHLQSTLHNLLVNARDALPDGGRVTIETANVHLDKAFVDEHFHADPGDYVMLAVIDNGTGMPPEVFERLFEPFFTTKEPGSGAGLGLCMAYAFVQQSGGFAKIDSEVGRGTAVRLYLKRAVEGVGRSDPVGVERDLVRPRSKGGEIVLAVEDDAPVRHVAATTLRELGYEVVEAEDGISAIEVLAGGQPVHVLFTDIAMPGGMSGRQLAQAAKRLRPGIKILYTSGYADRMKGHGAERNSPRLLKKPYRDYELASALRQVLDSATVSVPS